MKCLIQVSALSLLLFSQSSIGADKSSQEPKVNCPVHATEVYVPIGYYEHNAKTYSGCVVKLDANQIGVADGKKTELVDLIVGDDLPFGTRFFVDNSRLKQKSFRGSFSDLSVGDYVEVNNDCLGEAVHARYVKIDGSGELNKMCAE